MPQSVWGVGTGRQESKFHFPTSCPWVYFNISSHYSEGWQSGWWESTKGQKNWQRILVVWGVLVSLN